MNQWIRNNKGRCCKQCGVRDTAELHLRTEWYGWFCPRPVCTHKYKKNYTQIHKSVHKYTKVRTNTNVYANVKQLILHKLKWFFPLKKYSTIIATCNSKVRTDMRSTKGKHSLHRDHSVYPHLEGKVVGDGGSAGPKWDNWGVAVGIKTAPMGNKFGPFALSVPLQLQITCAPFKQVVTRCTDVFL